MNSTVFKIEKNICFVDVVLPLALSNTYTYRVPFNLINDIQHGKRVEVQFGKNKIYSAIIKRKHESAPSLYEAKNIISVIDENPIIYDLQIQLWEWISEYYICTIGEVMLAALPSALKLSSESKIKFHPEFDLENIQITENEEIIVEALRCQKFITIKDFSEILGVKTVYPLIRKMIEKKIICTSEELINKYKPKSEQYVMLSENYNEKNELKNLFDDLSKAPKQQELLMRYLQLRNEQSTHGKKKNQAILKKDLQNKVGGEVLKALVKKRIFKIELKETSRLEQFENIETANFDMSVSQQRAFDSISKLWEEKKVVLLHGETSSGKTNIYIKLLQKYLQAGEQALYLLPEIALTTQIIQRLRNYFGNRVGVYHSRFSDNERVELWNNILNGNYDLVIGARSAIFLPFKKLSIIIVDEEHDPSYKQFDPAPRYNARDTAIYLAHTCSAKILLGSATPSFESYFNTKISKYSLVSLPERYGELKLPKMEIVDLSEQFKKHKMKASFSEPLINEIGEALVKKEQVILFQNRRGFVPYLECNSCGFVPKCKNCDVSLTYHKFDNELRCHYCGYYQNVIPACIVCGDVNMRLKGLGTEKVEDDLKVFFPDAKIARLDYDSTRSKYGYSRIINNFSMREIDILVGTQMVTKGLDFENVNLVGILNADALLKYPDFRAYEHAYQLMAQVSGRAGRKHKQGKVIMQAYSPSHFVIDHVSRNDYIGLFDNLMKERQIHFYPPFSRLIRITLKHKEIGSINAKSLTLVKEIKKKFNLQIMGPEYPPVKRVNNLYIKNILMKIPKGENTKENKSLLYKTIQLFLSNKENNSVKVVIDVDPLR